MLLQQFDNIFNEHCCLPMDKSISKKQFLYLKHLQQRASGKFHPTIKKQTLKPESICPVNQKAKRAKNKIKRVTRIPPLLKRRLLQECVARKAKVVLTKIEDCPDVNAVWIYDRSMGKYRWINYSNAASYEDRCEKKMQGFSEGNADEVSFVITEVRGNASDVFESVCFSSDAETEATVNYSEDNTESETDLGEIVEVHESYNPMFQGQNITVQVDEHETLEGPLNYEIKPNKNMNPNIEDIGDDKTVDRENSCANSLDINTACNDKATQESQRNGRSSPFTRKIGGKTKRRRRKRYLNKTINKNSNSLYYRKGSGNQKTERRSFTFLKEKRTSRIGKHSKRFREIMKSAPRYWRSRSNLGSKKLINKKNTEDERKPTIPLKLRLLETCRKFPETDNHNKELFHIVDSKPENITPLKKLDLSEKAIKLCIRRKNSKACKCSNEDHSSSQANSTDGVSTKKKTDKQGATSNNITSDDGYSLLDQELPGYNWLEKKIKSGEIKVPRRTSTTSQDNASAAVEVIKTQEVDPHIRNTKVEDKRITTVLPQDSINDKIVQVQPQDSVNDKIVQEEIITPRNNIKPQTEVPLVKLQEESVFPSETKEPLEVTSPESGVEVDVAPLSAGDSEGDFLAQGIYLVINEDNINTGNNSFVDNATRDCMEKKEATMEQKTEECSGKLQAIPTESEIETRTEQEHICNNESCLLSAPERMKIAKQNNAVHSLEFSPPPVSWLKQAMIAEKKTEVHIRENGLITTYAPVSPPTSRASLINNQTKESETVSKETDFEHKDVESKEVSSVKSSNTAPQDFNSSYCNSIQNSTTTSEVQNEVSARNRPEDSSHNLPLNSVKDHIVNEIRVTMTNHIPVQQINMNPLNATPRKAVALQNTFLQSTSNLYGKSKHLQTLAQESSVNNNKHSASPQSNLTQTQMNNPVSNMNGNYAQASQECRTSYLKRPYERYPTSVTWTPLYPTQASYKLNFNCVSEPVSQTPENYSPNSLQNEKNFTISSLLELQSASAHSHKDFQTNNKIETAKPAEVRLNTEIHEIQPHKNATGDNNKVPSSTLRARLEGVQREKLPEAPNSDINEDSTDDIKIVYNKLATYQNQPVSVPVSNQSEVATKNYLPSAPRTQSPHPSFQDHHVQKVTKERPEQQNVSAAPISLPILPKPVPIQAPVRPSPVLVSPLTEKVDQQKIYQTPVSDSFQPVKRTPPQSDNASPGYQNISSYHAPPKSLRDEVEYRKRELMYLDQLARKREKEFERLQNIRKSKIRLLKLLENRIPIALNKECSTQQAVPYYYCPQAEKSVVSGYWTNQTNNQLVPSEKSDNNVTQPSQVTETMQVPNVCNSYQHFPPPNDRIRYELNHFISSFNNQMQEIRKDENALPTSRKEHDVPFNREPPQNISTATSSSISTFGMPQNSSLSNINLARVPPITHSKNRVMEVNPTTILPPTNYTEKGTNCQASYNVRPLQPPPSYSINPEAAKYQNLPVSHMNYSTSPYQNHSNYNSLCSGVPHKMVAPTVRLYDQQVVSSQSSAPNQHYQQKLKEDNTSTENAQQHYYGNKVWCDQPNWPKHNIQKIAPVNTPSYQPDTRIPSSFWPVTNPPVNVFSESQRLKFQSDVVQSRLEDSSIGLVFVDASKSSHACNYCNGNAIFLCSSCKKAWYCGRECQRRSWAQHSTVCVGD